VNGYYIQETEVTNGELIDEFSGQEVALPDSWKKYRTKLKQEGFEDSDVRLTAAAHVDHLFAEEYARKVGGRLLTEAEWEYAARSRGKSNRFAWDILAPGKPQAHIDEDVRLFPAKVKSMPDDMTEQRVFDMTGNVSEWCSDPYRHYRAILEAEGGKPNDRDHPRIDRVVGVEGPREAAPYVARGGSFQDSAGHSNNFERKHHKGSDQASFIGFRVVLECPPEVTSAKPPK
jgi:formylglycine-generating enzyme required for sulfatase activity